MKEDPRRPFLHTRSSMASGAGRRFHGQASDRSSIAVDALSTLREGAGGSVDGRLVDVPAPALAVPYTPRRSLGCEPVLRVGRRSRRCKVT